MPFCCCGAGKSSDIVAKTGTQLRHLEVLGLSRGPTPRLRRTEVQIPVTLNVYSLLESNKRLSKMGMGVFHTGVVVYGIEWGYGEVVDNPNATGLFCVHPGQAAGTLYRTIRIGYTTRSPMQVDTLLHRLENEWRSCEYHILHHNCNHFAQVFCDLLSTTEKLQVPPWCNRAARVGDRVIPRRLATKVQRLLDTEPPKAVAPVHFSKVNEVPYSVVPHEWYLHPSIFQPMRYTGTATPRSVRPPDRHRAGMTSQGGGSHYCVAYDLLPPPGYSSLDADHHNPPLPRREVETRSYGEDGTISHMMATEEQPFIPSSASRRSARKPTGTEATSKPHPERSSAKSPVEVTFSSRGSDRVEPLRVSAAAARPCSATSDEAPKISVLNLDAFPPSELDEAAFPLVVSQASISRSVSADVVSSGNEILTDTTPKQRRSRDAKEQQKHEDTCNQRFDHPSEKPSSERAEKPLYHTHDSSSVSDALESLEDSVSLRPSPSELLPVSHAALVGCITTVPPPLAGEIPEWATEHSGGSAVLESAASAVAAAGSVSGETSDPSCTSVALSKRQGGKKDKGLVTRKAKVELQGEFSDIAAGEQLADAPEQLSATITPAKVEEVKRMHTTALHILFKTSITRSSSRGNPDTVKKYLSSAPPDEEVASREGNTAPTKAAFSSPASSPLFPLFSQQPYEKRCDSPVFASRERSMNSARDVVVTSNLNEDSPRALVTPLSASPPFPPAPLPVLKGESDTYDAANPNSSATTSGRANSARDLNGDSLVMAAEQTGTLHYSATHLPIGREVRAGRSVGERPLSSRRHRLSECDVQSERMITLSPPAFAELRPTPASLRLCGSPAFVQPAFSVTPERANVKMSSEASLTRGSPAPTGKWLCHCGSTSAAMSDTPSRPAAHNRTPLPMHTRRCSDGNRSPFVQLDLLGEERDSPVRCSNARLGLALASDKAAHTPKALLPRRPSLQSREKAVVGTPRAFHCSASDLSHQDSPAQPSQSTKAARSAPLSPTRSNSLSVLGDAL